MFRDVLDEMQLTRAQVLSSDEFRQSVFGRSPLQPDQTSHEQPQTLALLNRALNVLQLELAALDEHLLQLFEIRGRQLFIVVELVNSDMVEVLFEIMPRLQSPCRSAFEKARRRLAS